MATRTPQCVATPRLQSSVSVLVQREQESVKKKVFLRPLDNAAYAASPLPEVQVV